MSQTFKYDPLEVLSRAEKDAGDWWSKTIDNAKKRTQLDQQHFDNAFKNDRLMQTYSSDLFKTNAENAFKGSKAVYDAMLEPDRYDTQKATYGMNTELAKMRGQDFAFANEAPNVDARRVLANNRYQSPAAQLEGAAAAAGIADRETANNVAAMTATYRPGALGAQATFGRQATDAGSFNIGSDIAMGSFESANQKLAKSGLGMQLEPGSDPAKVIIRFADGSTTPDLDQHDAANMIHDRTGQKPGQAQTYADRRETEARKFEQQWNLNQAKLDQKDRYVDFRRDSDERKTLVAVLNAANKSGDKERISRAEEDLRTFDSSGNASRAQAAPSGNMDAMMKKAPTAQQSAPLPASAAPVAAPAAAPVKYTPQPAAPAAPAAAPVERATASAPAPAAAAPSKDQYEKELMMMAHGELARFSPAAKAYSDMLKQQKIAQEQEQLRLMQAAELAKSRSLVYRPQMQ